MREAWLIVGRRGGKSRIAALLAVYVAAFRDYARVLAPGEKATVAVIAADRQQARVCFRYITGLLDAVPMLRALVLRQTANALELRGNVVIEVHTCSYRSTRGYSYAAVIADETAFWRDENSASPDVEVLNAVRPGLATVPGSMLIAISSPYSRRGALWQAFKAHYGQDGDPVLVWQSDTASMNPTVDAGIIAAAYERDEAAAAAEYGAQFRRDLEAFVSREAVDAVTVPARRELPRSAGCTYGGFLDPSGGGQDSFTLAIAHTEQRDGQDVAVLDVLREWRPPFNPALVVAEYAAVLKTYGISTVQADKYAGLWPVEAFQRHGITVEQSAAPKSDLYRDLLPLVNSGRVELLDHPRLHAQLLGLERRTARGGRDSIDHAPGAHDDLANAAAGALVTRPVQVDRRFLRRRSLLETIVRDDRWHPFSRLETTLHDGVQIYAETFDRDVPPQRAAHIAVSADRQAGAVAIGYTPGLRRVSRTAVAGGDGESDATGQEAPLLVLEAVLRIVTEPGCDVVPEEVLEFVLQIHNVVGLPLRWVTTAGVFSAVMRQMLRHRGLVPGELCADQLARGYDELRTAIYDGRVETYAYPPLLEALATLEVNAETGRIEAPAGVGALRPALGTELTEAAVGVAYVLMSRRESWGSPFSRPCNLHRPRGLRRPTGFAVLVVSPVTRARNHPLLSATIRC